MVNNALQLAGFALLIGFSWFVWEPAPLLVAGVLLVVWAEARQVRARRADQKAGPGAVDRVLAAIVAYRGDRR